MPTEQPQPSFYLLPPERCLPASALSIWLGQIVKSYSEPDANLVLDDPKPLETHEFARSIIANVSLAALPQQNKSFAAKLGATVDASRETSNGGRLSFTSSEVVCGSDFPASQSFARKHCNDSESESEESDLSNDDESDRENEIGSNDKSYDNYETVNNVKVVLDIDKDSVTWADVLDEEEEG
ncbi:hypothetical protein FGADI_5572 [Fusarium gaditjirri]|uniref:Uncharacterized protein n=1 Tax=Fusarium gaditjirri TaxID=282569 RepID=A0A8H4TA42_9HYPO|nr:hypothetical protein FGADI_5572 [Fusarium gaditjirri]